MVYWERIGLEREGMKVSTCVCTHPQLSTRTGDGQSSAGEQTYIAFFFSLPAGKTSLFPP